MEVVETKVNTFELPNKVVKVKPNPYNPGRIKDPRHVAFFKMEGCFDRLVCAVDRNNKRKNPFTKEEKDYLENILGLEPNALSVYKKDGYLVELDKTPIALGREPLILNLSDPLDYIKYKILLTNSEIVAPDFTEVKNKNYRYYIEDDESIAKAKTKESNFNMIAWKEYGKIEDNRQKMVAFLKVYSQMRGKSFATFKVDVNSKLELIQSKIVDIINSDIRAFVEVVQYEHFETALLIAESIESGEIKKQGTVYSLKHDGDRIGSTFSEAIAYLNNPVNQELRVMLETNNNKVSKK